MSEHPDSNPVPANPPELVAHRPSRVGWLLIIPLLLVGYPPLYNRSDPQWLGIPFFYWYQLVVIPVGVLCTVWVYRASRSGATGSTKDKR